MNQKLKYFLPATLFFLLVLAGKITRSANINVTDVAAPGNCIATPTPCPSFNGSDCELQDALSIAQCNLQDDTINVAAGTYDADAAGGFSYVAQGGENFDISIIGAGATSIVDGGNDDQCLEIDTNFTTDDQVAILVDSMTFQNGFFSGPGGGVSILTTDASVTVQNSVFSQNAAQLETGGGLNVVSDGNSSITVDRNQFIQNTTEDSGFAEDGGGAYLDTADGSISLNGNFFQLNTGSNGGGLFAEVGDDQNANLTAVNNIFTQNTALDNQGGGMFASGTLGITDITNNTIFNNTATDGTDGIGGGLFAQVTGATGTINIYNNIVFGNTAEATGDDIVTCTFDDTSPINLFNNDFLEYVDGGTIGSLGCVTTTNFLEGSNIPDDPQFVNSGAADFHLLATSPAIDTGELNPPGGLPTPDFDGVTRPQGPLPDMGALEFQIIPTPTPTPIPIPTPTPLPSNPQLEGSGLLSCSFHQGLTMIPAQAWTGFISLIAGLGFFMVLRRKAR